MRTARSIAIALGDWRAMLPGSALLACDMTGLSAMDHYGDGYHGAGYYGRGAIAMAWTAMHQGAHTPSSGLT